MYAYFVPGYRNGTESFLGLKGRPSVVRDVKIHNQPVSYGPLIMSIMLIMSCYTGFFNVRRGWQSLNTGPRFYLRLIRRTFVDFASLCCVSCVYCYLFIFVSDKKSVGVQNNFIVIGLTGPTS
jgi:hypothetical protein